jgi:hypothetical protein
MATTTAVTGQPKRNDGGTVVFAGAAAGSRVTNSPDYTEMAGAKPVPGSKVAGPETNATIAAGTDTKGTFAPISSGKFAEQEATKYVIRTAQTRLAQTAYANGVFAGADWGNVRYPQPKESVRTIHITDWSYITGTATVAGTTTDSFGTDQAARPTRSVPGELVYLATGKTPTQADYPAKTG